MAANKRRLSTCVNIGNVPVGGQAPIVVQSMTNTSTEDIASTAKQIEELVNHYCIENNSK